MMKGMMNAMVSNMSVEEREKMILTMMPEMMKRTEAKVLVPNMLRTFGDLVTFTKTYDFIVALTKSGQLKKAVGKQLSGLKEKIPAMMEGMMPMMISIMPKVMPKMMSFMMPMMSAMMMDKDGNGGCMMAEMAEQDEEMRDTMSDMMLEHCPPMIGKIMPDEKAEEFMQRMSESLGKK